MQKNLSNTGKRIIKTGIFFNILLFIVAVILLIKGDFFGHSTWMIVYNILSIPVIVYWIYLLRWWYIYDKDIHHFLGLFFLIGFYSIYYGNKVLKVMKKKQASF
jgi:carbon starvation protein CstA